ncbi:MAG: hypothetical protein ABEI86_11700, partial [Halobacteriaceae archaeon]
IVRSPEIHQSTVDTPVQHFDIPPTLLEAANCSIPPHLEGEPLQDINDHSERTIFFTLTEETAGVRQSNWKYIKTNGNKMLFNSEHGKPDGETVVNEGKINELSSKLEQYLKSLTTIGGDNNNQAISPEVKENLSDLGYR